MATVEEFADAYNEASRRSRSPLVDVASALGVSQSTATRRVAEARSRGLIAPPADGRKLAGVSPALRAVADELGVDVLALRAAIIAHAKGRLIVR